MSIKKNTDEINNCLYILRQGGLILYPTDTIWGIGCDATNMEAVDKIYKIKQRSDSKALISLVADKKQLEIYTSIQTELIDSNIPTTVIYPKVIGLAKNLLANDNSAAIRVTKDEFCKKLIKKFKKAIVSTSANISGQNHPERFSDINPLILNKVDYIVNLRQQETMKKPSTILRIIQNGEIQKIR